MHPPEELKSAGITASGTLKTATLSALPESTNQPPRGPARSRVSGCPVSWFALNGWTSHHFVGWLDQPPLRRVVADLDVIGHACSLSCWFCGIADQAQAGAHGRCFGAVADSELVEDAGHVHGDGAVADEQRAGDLPVAVPPDQAAKYFHLPVGQVEPGGRLRGAGGAGRSRR